MIEFYTSFETRSIYETQLVASVSEQACPESPRGRAIQFLAATQSPSILEVGASTGRGYRQLRAAGFSGHYTGIEPSNDIIAQNCTNFPQAKWVPASAYKLPMNDNSVPLIYSEYVLEHLVHPQIALEEMARVLSPGGAALLLFPDFQASGRFGSQMLGLTPIRRAREKLSKGLLFDLIVSLYDSRIRLPYALARACQQVGPFPVNLAPRCLKIPTPAYDDYDAVYIASKREVQNWAENRRLRVDYPAGTERVFRDQALMVLRKPS